VWIVRRELKVPLEPSRVRIERDDAVRIEIVARPLIRVPVRTGIADSPIHQIQIGIVRSGQPDRRTTVLPVVALPRLVARLVRARNRVEAPGFATGLRVICGDEAANSVLAAGDADDNLVL